MSHPLLKSSSRSLKFTLPWFLVALAVAGLGISTVHADLAWNNGASNFLWDTSSLNWTGSAWTAGGNATFGATGAGAITVNGTQSVQNITDSVAGYSFTGGTLSTASKTAANTWSFASATAISSNVTADFTGGNSTGTLIMSISLGKKLTLGGTVNVTGFNGTTGNTGIDVQGTGTLELTGTSTFTNARLKAAAGSVTISSGTHNFTGTTAGNLGISVGGSNVLTVSGGNVTTKRLIIANGSSATYSQSAGTVIVNNSAGVECGSGAGGTRVTFNLDGGTFEAGKIAATAGWLGNSTINLHGGTFRANATEATNIFSTDISGSIAGNVFVKAGGAVIDSNGYNITQTQSLKTDAVSTGGGLTKLGAGILTLVGANTYTGSTMVTAGALHIGSGGSLASGNALTVGAGGTADFANAGQTLGAVSNANTAISALNFSASTGTVTLGNLSGVGSTRFGNNGAITTLNGGSIILGNSTALTVNNGSTTGTISGGGSLTKATSGMLALNGANSYTGATTVADGTLKAAAANALGSTSGIMVNTGGTLLISANGSLGSTSNITMNSTSTGNGTVAALKFSSSYNGTVGALVLDYNSIFDLGTDATGVQIHFSSIFLNGYTLSIYNWTGTTLWEGGTGNNTDQIYAGNTLDAGDLNRISFYSGLDTSSFRGTGYQIMTGSFMNELGPVPEPSTWVAMATLAITGGTISMRRRTRQATGIL